MGAKRDDLKKRALAWRKKPRDWATGKAAPRLKAIGRAIAPTKPVFYIVCFVSLAASSTDAQSPRSLGSNS